MRRNAIATTPVAVTQYLDAVNVRKVIRAVTCYIEAFLNVKVVILHICFQHTYTVYQIFYGGSYWILVSKKYELLSTMELLFLIKELGFIHVEAALRMVDHSQLMFPCYRFSSILPLFELFRE